MEIVDGKYTGNIDYYAYAEEKARAIEHLAETVGYDLAECYAYSDSVTDVHMLEVVGHPFAVNPDRELRRIATRQRVAGPELRPTGRAAPARSPSRRPSRRSPRSPSAAPSRPGASSGPTAASGPRRLSGAPHPPATAKVKPCGRRSGRTRTESNNSTAAREPGTHAAIHPSDGVLAIRDLLEGGDLENARLVATASRVSGGTRSS